MTPRVCAPTIFAMVGALLFSIPPSTAQANPLLWQLVLRAGTAGAARSAIANAGRNVVVNVARGGRAFVRSNPRYYSTTLSVASSALPYAGSANAYSNSSQSSYDSYSNAASHEPSYQQSYEPAYQTSYEPSYEPVYYEPSYSRDDQHEYVNSYETGYSRSSYEQTVYYEPSYAQETYANVQSCDVVCVDGDLYKVCQD